MTGIILPGTKPGPNTLGDLLHRDLAGWELGLVHYAIRDERVGGHNVGRSWLVLSMTGQLLLTNSSSGLERGLREAEIRDAWEGRFTYALLDHKNGMAFFVGRTNLPTDRAIPYASFPIRGAFELGSLSWVQAPSL